jgi:hypothetical protein
MHPWTADRVLSLAPDSASASAGQGLATPRKWSGVGRSDRAVWGLCQGSGKDPYQTRVDLGEPAFKCSCPSRKFPCKHGIALLLMLAKDEGSFKQAAEPGWVSDWLSTRGEKKERKEERAKASADKPVDVEAQAKRAAQREARVADGVAGCRVWLEDVVRRGLAAVRAEADASCERMAARLVDAQAAGLAAMVRRLPEVLASGDGWEVRATDHLGRIALLLAAAERLPSLPVDLAIDVRTALGWNQSKDDVLTSGTTIRDRWLAVGQVVEDDDRLRVRRAWMLGMRTGRRALVLDFAAGTTPFPPIVAPGATFEGEIAMYPGRALMRGIVKTAESVSVADTATTRAVADATIEAGLRRYAEALAVNPWLAQWCLTLDSVRLLRRDTGWLIGDSTGTSLPLRPAFATSLRVWQLLSATGGEAATLTVEWDGFTALPLSVWNAGGLHDLSSRWAADFHTREGAA